jgi:hypothetical protein
MPPLKQIQQTQDITWQEHPRMEKLEQIRPGIREQIRQRSVEPSLWPVLPLEEQLRQREAMYVPERFIKQMDDRIEQLMQRQSFGRVSW